MATASRRCWRRVSGISGIGWKMARAPINPPPGDGAAEAGAVGRGSGVAGALAGASAAGGGPGCCGALGGGGRFFGRGGGGLISALGSGGHSFGGGVTPRGPGGAGWGNGSRGAT